MIDVCCEYFDCIAYLDIDYKELQNFNLVQSEEEDNAEFSTINPNLLDLDLEGSGSASNAPVMSTRIDNLLLSSNEQFMKYVLSWVKVKSICSIL